MRKNLIIAAGLALVLVALAVGVFGQNSPIWGYRFLAGSFIGSGPGSGMFTESSYNYGPDSGFARLGVGQIGQVNGGVNYNPEAVLTPPAVVSLSNASSGGSIPAGTYTAALAYITPTGGITNITSTQEATTAPTGGTSTITFTSPIAEAGAAGYLIYINPVAGGGTLAENLQPINATVCAGAFSITLPNASSQMACPIGTNAVITSVTTGPAIQSINSAAFPMAVPQLVCNMVAGPLLTTITTAQTLGSCILAPGIQNVSGKVLRVTGHLIYTGTGTPTVTVAATEGGITPVTVTSLAVTTGGQTKAQVEFDFYLTTSTTGSSGNLEGHGHINVQLATASLTAAMAQYNDGLSAVSSAINLTASNTLAITIAFSTSETSAQLRDAQVWMLN